MRFLNYGIATALLLIAANSPAHTQTVALDLNTGYRQMYNLDFVGAHKTFAQWEQLHPDDPLGPVSNAAAYLFAEFKRLKTLEFDLFTENAKFEERPKLAPDPTVKTSFESELSRSDQLANRKLAATPNDAHALLALLMANGLRGDYAALIERRNLAALSYIKKARELAEKVLSADPTCYDAHLAVGVENYLLSLHPAPIRWILRLGGAQTDKTEGVQKLRLTAQKGHYLAPYARLLLAVVALRDKDQNTARDLLEGLACEFPQNDLYRKELAHISPHPAALAGNPCPMLRLESSDRSDINLNRVADAQKERTWIF
ncbi:MAG TPA: hypothetical protein VFA76_09905 [Terriglobales bacterium]|nr:hypothetical protein [Terriglobales bacterium]